MREPKRLKSYTSPPTPLRMLKEQFRLFVFNGSLLPTPEISARLKKDFSKRERLAALLEGDLNFHGENSRYASHDLHSFAAKFPPQLPRAFIRGLTNIGDVVLDPMMGSGTTPLSKHSPKDDRELVSILTLWPFASGAKRR